MNFALDFNFTYCCLAPLQLSALTGTKQQVMLSFTLVASTAFSTELTLTPAIVCLQYERGWNTDQSLGLESRLAASFLEDSYREGV